MAAVKPASQGKRLVQRTERHRERHIEGPVKASDGIGENPRLVSDRRSDPGVRQLKQQGAACAKENSRLTVDPPAHRRRAENALARPGSAGANSLETTFKVFNGYKHNS
jgi:hypothetical protein